MEKLLRALPWRRLDGAGVEHFRLRQAAEGWRLRGAVVLASEGVPLEVRYEVVCSHAWGTRSACIELGMRIRREMA